MDVAQLLSETQEKFNKKNSWLSWDRLGYVFIIPILQILSLVVFWKVRNRKKLVGCPLIRLYLRCRYQFLLLKGGNVVWGYLVQGNSELFKPGKTNLYAYFVYNPNLTINNNLPELARIAWELYELKGKKIEHPEVLDLKPIAKAITNEYHRSFTIKVPSSIAREQTVYFASAIVYRQHLPQGNLQSNWFPVLIAPDSTKEVMILPCKYWPQDLLQGWQKKPVN